MPLYNDTAIMIRGHDFGEADKIVSFFCKNHGKIRVVAKGARKLKSQFAGRLEPFHRLDITYFGRENVGLYKLSAVDLDSARSAIADDLERFHRACYVTEFIELATRDGDPNPRAFMAADATLELLCAETKPRDMDWITRFFDVKLLNHLGYGPTLDRCIDCGGALHEQGSLAFDVSRGGVLCATCRRKSGRTTPLSQGAAKFLSRIVSTEFSKASRLKPSPALMNEITGVVSAFRDSRIQSKMKSERFFAGASNL
jgi:DNA repair protein RecO (recombination protein O)